MVLSVVAAVVAHDQNQRQSALLLRAQTDQAAQEAGSTFGSLITTVTSLAQVVQITGGSVSVFDQQTAGYTNPLAVALAQRRGDGFVVVAGNGFAVGSPLPASALPVLERVGGQVQPTAVVRRGNVSTVGLAIGPPSVPSGDVIYFQFTVDPFTATPATQGRPFQLLAVALYGTKHQDPRSLIVTTTRSVPLTGQLASAPVPVGNGIWTLVATPRRALTGSLAEATPWIVLGIGLLVALLLGTVIEVLVRRQRFARALVADRTAELVASQEALVRSERLSAVGEMTTVIGHELRNPLAAVINAHFLVSEAIECGELAAARQYMGVAERETERAATLAEDLTAYMRQRPPEPIPVRVEQVVDEVLEATPPPQGIAVDKDIAPLTAQVDDRQIHQIVTNLMANAYQAMPDGGIVKLSTGRDGDQVLFTVQDAGAGFPPEELDRVFEPFYTTKAHGTGLGLAIVRRLAEGNGGSVRAENGPEGGALVTVRLPGHGNGRA